VRPPPSRLFGCGYAALWSRLFSPGSPPGLPPALVGQTFLSAAGISCGASRQACHTGSPAGGWLSTAALPQAALVGQASRCGAVTLACGRVSWNTLLLWGRQLLWGRPSSLRPAFQPALAPLPTALCATQSPRCPQVEQAARLAMPAVTPAERHNPDLVREFQRHPARTTACSTSTRRRRKVEQAARLPTPGLPVEQAVLLPTPAIHVEQAARLAMPAVAPAEPHNPDLCESSKRHPARTPPHSTSTRPLSSYLRVLCALCGLVFSVSSVVCFSPCSPCPLWFAFSVFSVVCFSCALPTPSHNLPQTFFPFLFNHFPTPPFSSSCSYLVC